MYKRCGEQKQMFVPGAYENLNSNASERVHNRWVQDTEKVAGLQTAYTYK